MKLTSEIRNLAGRKRLHRNRRLKTACHEASHALIHLQVGMPFVRIEVGDLTVDHQRHAGAAIEKVSIRGRVIQASDYKVYPRTAEAAAQISLAGHVFDGIVDPLADGRREHAVYTPLNGEVIEAIPPALCPPANPLDRLSIIV